MQDSIGCLEGFGETDTVLNKGGSFFSVIND